MDKIIQCFKDDFDRFWGLMEKQIEVCPDALWNKKGGGYVFWQQVLHSIACAELFALTGVDDKTVLLDKYDREIIFLLKEPDFEVSKATMLEHARLAKAVADKFVTGLSAANLTDTQPRLSKTFGREQTMQNAVMALIRHCNYHLGCCDAVLRENGVKGVY